MAIYLSSRLLKKKKKKFNQTGIETKIATIKCANTKESIIQPAPFNLSPIVNVENEFSFL
jgi:hypothetical protein